MNKKEIKKHERFICDYLGIKLRLYKIDYKYLEGPKLKKDCTTRTIARLLNIPYQDVLKKQLELALEYEQVHANYYKITMDILSEYGYEMKRIKSKDRYISVGEFMATHKKGRYAISANRHIVAYINGTWYDDKYNFRCPDYFFVQKVGAIFYESKNKLDLNIK